jgi:HEAT repeat protein
MPTVERYLSYLYGSRRELQIRAARDILAFEVPIPLKDLLFILDEFHAEGLGAATEKALMKRTTPELVGGMKVRLESPSPFVREVACNLLGRSGDMSATPDLIAKLRDPNMMVRRSAAFGLAFLKDPSALDAVRTVAAASADDDINVQMALNCAIRELRSVSDEGE